MRIFEADERWHGKINFVDEADVYVGFSWGSLCCESFGYYFVSDPTHKRDEALSLTSEELTPLFFDVEFFKERPGYDRGGEAVFRLFNPHETADPIYLVLYNHHNGYYSHGFSMEVGGENVRRGSL